MPLQWHDIHIPLAAGVDTKADELALEPPRLAVCENAVFEEHGGIQKRPGFKYLNVNLHEGSAVANRMRGLGVRGDELVMFAEGKCRSYSDEYGTWADRGRFESVLVDHRSVAHDRNDQIRGDRARQNDVILYAWEDRKESKVKWQLVDAVTRAILPQNAVQEVASASKPICRAIGGRLHLYYLTTGKVSVLAFDLTSRATLYTVPTATDLVTDRHATGTYDVVRKGTTAGILVCSVTVNSCRVMDVTAAGAIGASNVVKARACELGVACARSGKAPTDLLAVVRQTGGTDVQLDWLDVANGFADDTVSIVVDTGGANTMGDVTVVGLLESTGAYVYWTERASASPKNDRVKRRVVTATAVSGAVKTLCNHARLASRAALWTESTVERVLVHVIHDTAQQPMYALLEGLFVVGDDINEQDGGGGQTGTDELGLLAHILPRTATDSTYVSMPLPQIEELASDANVFSCMLGNRRRLDNVTDDAFTERGLEDVVYTFADPRAYRCVQEGATLYIPGGYLAAYAGGRVLESEFLLYPEEVDLVASNGSGSLTVAKTYSYKCYWERQLANGEMQRSAYAKTYSKLLGAAEDTIQLTLPTNPFTNDMNAALAVYRTEADPGVDAPYYRVSSLDPTATGLNGYIRNDPSKVTLTFDDGMSDTTLITKEQDQNNPGALGTKLDDIPPPAPRVVQAGQARLFALDPSDKTIVWYSQIRSAGDGVHFSDALSLRIPQHGGDVTAIEVTDSAILVFAERAIFVVHGQGPDNLGNGGYSAPQQVVSGVGCADARTTVRIPPGVLFESDKGIYLLDGNYQTSYVGAQVENFNSRTIAGAVDVPDRHHARFLMTGSAEGFLVYDYLINEWSVWNDSDTLLTGTALVVWQDTTVHLHQPSNGGPYRSDATIYTDGASSLGYGLIVETGWIKLAGLQGFGRARWLSVLGEQRSNHDVRVRIAYNYVDSWIQNRTLTVAATAGRPQQYRMRFGRQRVEAVKIRIEDEAWAGTKESTKLTGLSLQIGIKPGLARFGAGVGAAAAAVPVGPPVGSIIVQS